MDFIEQYVRLRFRLWSNRADLFIIYEAFPEEGSDVSKKLKQFNNQPEAEEWLTLHMELYSKWLRTFMVTTASTPAGSPPSALTTSSALQRLKAKQRASSEQKSKPGTVTTPGSSSSATSPPSSGE